MERQGREVTARSSVTGGVLVSSGDVLQKSGMDICQDGALLGEYSSDELTDCEDFVNWVFKQEEAK